jgi:hypothetical protein
MELKLGGCGADGKQYYRRDVVNSGATTSKSENCCFIGAWGGGTSSGDCNGSKRPHTRTRTVLNCPSGTVTTENQQRNCNHCQGKWVEDGARLHKYNRQLCKNWGWLQYKHITIERKFINIK